VRGTAADQYGVYGEAGGYGVFGCSTGHYGVYGQAAGYGVYGCSAGDYGVYARATCFGVYGYASCNYAVIGNANCCYGVRGLANQRPVAGNGAYYNTSSQMLKYKEPICITECLKKRPLKVYKYLWEDANQKGYDQFIGPMAEDYQSTFKLTHDRDGIFQPAGTALGLGIELLERVEKLEKELKSIKDKKGE
jgi:hypothetical protein